jgi:hypothetical protein
MSPKNMEHRVKISIIAWTKLFLIAKKHKNRDSTTQREFKSRKTMKIIKKE